MSLRKQFEGCRDIEKAVAKDLGAVSAVTHVFTEAADNALLAWIVVDDPKLDIRYEIFDKEQALIDAFPETEFDFNIIPRMGRDARELIQGEARIAYTRSSAVQG
ncbi:MAG: hypothetical protein ACRD45_19400 [Bryobacteraceae bacterium]